MFDLRKTPTIWTLSFRASRGLRGVWMLFLLVILAVSGFYIIDLLRQGDERLALLMAGLFALPSLTLVGFVLLREADTETEFDFALRQLRLRSSRPFAGAPRVHPFGHVVALLARPEGGKSNRDVAIIELAGEGRIRLGAQARGRDNRLAEMLAEVRGRIELATRDG